MILINNFKKKRAVSPVVATVLLISLVVASSAIVFFIVVPMLQGSASIDFISAQWFDSKESDDVVDIVYITLQSTGTASAPITNITITVQNGDTTVTLTNTTTQGVTFPYEVEVASRLDFAIEFNATEYIDLGENIFRLKAFFAEGNFVQASDELRHVDQIQELDLSILNPTNDSWNSEILDPQAIAVGGYKPSAVTYDFYDPVGTPIATDQAITTNIDTTVYTDDAGYELVFHVSDALGQSIDVTRVFGIDNVAIDITALYLNGTTSGTLDVEQGEALNVSWSLNIVGAGVFLQELLIQGDIYPEAGSKVSGITPSTTEYILSNTETVTLPEDTYTYTLRVVDEAGNIQTRGRTFNLADTLGPTTYFLAPDNESTDLSETIRIEVYASDPSGIDEVLFEVYFRAINLAFTETYVNFIEEDAVYNSDSKTWILDFNTYRLQNDDYEVEAFVIDKAGNSASAFVYFSVYNDILDLSGVSKVRNFFSPSEISFYLTNNLPTDMNISKFYIDWENDNRAEHMTGMSDSASNIWLSTGSTYNEEVEHDLSFGDVTLGPSETVRVTILLNPFDNIPAATIEMRFYLTDLAVWITFTGL